MNDAFSHKIMRDGLSAEDTSLLANSYHCIDLIPARTNIIGYASQAQQIHILLDGWAYKYRLLDEGRRQILRVHLPGEICDLDRVFDSEPGFGILAASNCRVAALPLHWIMRAVTERQAIRNLFWSLTVFENVACGEQIISLGRRTARERIAFFLCDLLHRLQALDQAIDNRFRLPITQIDIADHLGLSTVHVNRTLQDLKNEGLIKNSGRTYEIRDRDRLETIASFSGLKHKGANPAWFRAVAARR